MRSGRLDRKIELPHPTEEARMRILMVNWILFSIALAVVCKFRHFRQFFMGQ